ncbi:uncharacterized protein EDB91DRAFT_1299874 [Suillus paluster]|uniref:uncharacterized protein n=1 Tax=Suillus paluster TaxID=48578 RepID=UPI001B86BF4F|nr:uncharacterized protein EDB91DRAFT_1299874 [Suillus paluster]KAG1733603.1 hypothetical protein EDB91DRAFT_1299874 [Suillus paluster]
MSDGINDWIVPDSEDEDGFQPLVVADQSVPLSRSSFSAHSTSISQASVIQTASLFSSPARTPRRVHNSLDINDSLFTPPPGYQDSDSPHASPSLPRDVETSVPKSKPRPRPGPRKSRATNTIYDDFLNEDASRAFGSLISSASAIPASTLAADSIRAPTTPSIVSELIEDVNPTFIISERAKTQKMQAKNPTYLPLAHDVIELSSDSDLDEISLKPPRKRHKSQDKLVKPKPKPKPKSKARKSPSPKLAERLPSMASHLSSSLPPLPELSSSPSSPPVTTRKRKRAPPLEPDIQGEEMDVDVSHGSLSITEPPLFFAQSSPVVLPIDDSHVLEEENKDVDADVVATGTKGRKKDTKSSTRTKEKKKGRKEADEVEFDDLAHKSPPDEAAAGNDDLAEDDFIVEEAPKATSKKGAPPKPKPAAKIKSKPKGKGKVVLSEGENEEDDPPCAKSPSRSRHLPENELDKPGGGSPKKDSKIIADSATIKKNSPQSIAAPPKQTPSIGLNSRFTIKSKSIPMSELIRRVNSRPNSPFTNAPTYSPLMKSSRTMLSRIAPLHPNRRTPPPSLPRPPPPKKSKKQIEMEERIEEELAETVEGWSCMTDEERRNLRRARIDAELGCE